MVQGVERFIRRAQINEMLETRSRTQTLDECITKRFAMTRKNGLTGVKGHVLKELVYTNQTIVAHHEAEESYYQQS